MGNFHSAIRSLEACKRTNFPEARSVVKQRAKGHRPEEGRGKDKEGLSVNVGTATSIFWLFRLHVCEMRGLKEGSVMKLSAVTSLHNQLRSKSAEYHGNWRRVSKSRHEEVACIHCGRCQGLSNQRMSLH